MAGHSKWANIKRHKAKQDAKRGKLYTKIIRELTVAAKQSGDPNANPRLRAALEKAQEANMTKDVIERAIKRGSGGLEGENVEEVRYEGYGPGGTAFIVDCMTNNRNRTVAEVRHAFTKHGGNLGTDGSVSFLFKKAGQLTFAPGLDEDELTLLALDLNALDVIVNEDKSIDILTVPDDFYQIKSALVAKGMQPAQADISMVAETKVIVSAKEMAEKIMSLMDTLDDLDDVQAVFNNVEMGDEVLS